MASVDPDVLSHKENLKRLYRTKEFMVSSSNQEEGHVKDYEFDISSYQTSKVDEGTTFRDRSPCRKQAKTKSIPLETLSDPLRGDFETSISEVSKILLTAPPGSGKTSLSKKIAFSWAEGSFGTALDAVYVLPIEFLHQRFQEIKTHSENTLDAALANFYLVLFGSDTCEKIHHQILKDLQKKTTLVILDGLDSSDLTIKFMEHVFVSDCKLLLLSRPLDLGDLRQKVDIEMQCLGMNDEQLKRFFSRKFSSAEPSIWTYLKSKPRIASIAHLPLVANHFYDLWKAKEGRNDGKGFGLSDYELLTELTNFFWKRFSEKPTFPKDVNREETFEVLSRIAFDCESIDEASFSDVVKQASLKNVLQESGFLLFNDKTTSYQFIHDSFAEYFAGLRLASLLDSAAQKTEAVMYIQENKYKTFHQNVLSFVMESKGEMAFLIEMFSIVDQEPLEILGVKHLYLKLRLLEAFLSARGENDEKARESVECKAIVEAASMLVFVLQKEKECWKEAVSFLSQLENTIRAFPCIAALVLLPLELQGTQIHSETESDASIDDPKAVLKSFVNRFEKHLTTQPPTLTQSSEMTTLFRSVEKDILDWTSERAQIVVAFALNVAKHVPNTRDYVFHLFLEVSKHSSLSNVRCSVIQGIQCISNKEEEAFEVMVSKCDDSDKDVRYSAIKGISKLAIALPEKVSQAYELLKSKCQNDDRMVCCVAVESIARLAIQSPDKADNALELLSSKLEEDDREIRRVAVDSMLHLAKALPKKVTEAIQTLSVKIQNEDWRTRRFAIEEISHLATTTPESIGDALEIFSAASKDEDWRVRRIVVKGVANLGKASTTHSKLAFEILSKNCNDEDEDVRRCAIKGIANLTSLSPEMLSQAFTILSKRSFDDDKDVRCATVNGITSLIKLSPDRASSAFEILEAKCDDPDEDVRRCTVEAISSLAKLAPEVTLQSFELLSDKCHDEDWVVRHCAVEAMVSLAKVSPEKATDAFEVLLSKCRDEDEDVRRRAVETLSRLADWIPQKGSEAFKVLLDKCDDDDEDVCRRAVEAIAMLGKKSPEQASKAIELLSIKCQNNNRRIRRSAVKGIANLAEMAPDNIFMILMGRCQDNDRVIRRCAVECIASISKTLQDKAFEAMDVLASCCQDSNDDVRQCAMDGLSELSALSMDLFRHLVEVSQDLSSKNSKLESTVQQIFDHASLKHAVALTLRDRFDSDRVLASIGIQLLESVLTLRAQGDKQELSLFDTRGKTEWQSSVQETRDFISRVKKIFSVRCPFAFCCLHQIQ